MPTSSHTGSHILNIGQVAADVSETAKREADKKKVAVTISLIGKTANLTCQDVQYQCISSTYAVYFDNNSIFCKE